jgi:hypothetical protein
LFKFIINSGAPPAAAAAAAAAPPVVGDVDENDVVVLTDANAKSILSDGMFFF